MARRLEERKTKWKDLQVEPAKEHTGELGASAEAESGTKVRLETLGQNASNSPPAGSCSLDAAEFCDPPGLSRGVLGLCCRSL